MTKTLQTLIRLSKFDVDEKRRLLSLVLEKETILQQRLQKINQAFEQEKMLASDNSDLQHSFGAYATRFRKQRHSLEGKLQALQPEIVKARDALAQAFEEMKRFEITKEQQEEIALADEKRLEQVEMDDLTGVRTGRAI